MKEIINGAYILSKKVELDSLIDETISIAHAIDLKTELNSLSEIKKNLATDSFNIAVVGGFVSGKSSFINALLEEDVLETSPFPKIGPIEQFKYDEHRRIVLHFNDNISDQLLAAAPSKIQSYIKSNKSGNIPPLQIKHEELSDYIVYSIENWFAETPYSKVEIYGPYEIIANNVCILNIPSFSSAHMSMYSLLNSLANTDALIFVLSSYNILSSEEMRVLEFLNEYKFKDVFFVVNKMDLIDDKERELLHEYVERKLSHINKNGIYYLSAREANIERGEKEGNERDFSGIDQFKNSLMAIIAERKFSKQILKIKRIIDILSTKLDKLNTCLCEIDDNNATVKRYLEESKVRETTLLEQRLMLKIERNRHEILNDFIHNKHFIINRIFAWIEGYEPATKLNMFSSRVKVQSLLEEYVNFLSIKINEEIYRWKENNLLPIIDAQLKDICDFIDYQTSEIYSKINDIIECNLTKRAEPLIVPDWKRYFILNKDIQYNSLSELTHDVSVKLITESLNRSMLHNYMFYPPMMGMVMPNPVPEILRFILAPRLTPQAVKNEIKKKLKETLPDYIENKYLELYKNVNVELDKVKIDIISNVTKAIDSDLEILISPLSSQHNKNQSESNELIEYKKSLKNIESRLYKLFL